MLSVTSYTLSLPPAPRGRTHTRTNAYMNKGKHAFTHTRIHARMHARTHTRMHARTRASEQPCIRKQRNTLAYKHMHINTSWVNRACVIKAS